MRYSFLVYALLLSLFSTFMFSCNNNQPQNDEGTTTEVSTDQTTIEKEWDQLKDNYHMVMAETFHPAEEGNLEPVNTRYSELTEKAEVWADATLPEKYKAQKFDESLQRLVKASKDLGYIIESESSDAEIKDAIFKLHDHFHEIQGKCDH